MLEKKLTYIFSSNPENGATNVSADGSRFTVNLYEPIAIPAHAEYCTMEVLSAQIWNTIPNISATANNNIFKYNDGLADRTLVIPDGLYDLKLLSQSIAILTDNIPGAVPSEDTFVFTGDNSTQKVLITFKSAGLVIDWNTSTVRTILGYTVNATTTAGIDETIASDADVARFNTINSFLIHTDIIHTGIPVNNISTAVIADVPITVKPGSLIVYQPQNIPSADSTELIGAQLSTIDFYLTNETNIPVNTNSEFYSFVLVIKYWI